MAEEEEVELSEEQQQRLALRQRLDERTGPPLASVDDFRVRVLQDPDRLVVVAALSAQSPHCADRTERAYAALSAPRKATRNAAFVRFDALDVPALSQQLGIQQVPTILFFLKGEEWERFSGSNAEKISGLFRNNLIKRNDVMREYDAAKNAKPADAEAEENEEGEEGEDGDE